MPTLKINGIEVTVDKGTTILHAARKAGLEIPVFCYHDKLEPMGACRVCMVELTTPRGPVLTIACATPATDGLEVKIDAPAAVKERNGVIEFLLANHPLDCPVCDRGGECDLQDNTFRFGPGVSRFEEPKRVWDDYDMGPYVARCQNRCIRCYRCVRYYDEIVGKAELGAFTRGATMEIRTFEDRPLETGLSGNLSEVCPVGALLDKTYLYRARPWEIRDSPTTCSQCSYGCSMRVGIRQGKVLRTKPLANDLVNEVWLCDRGRFAHTRRQPDRLNSPLIRKDGKLQPVSWDEASRVIAAEIGAILKEEGPAAVGGIASGRPTNEDLYAFQKFLRVAIGTNNIAHRAFDLGDALLSTLKVEAATNSIVGLEQSKVFLVVGSDLVVSQPVMGTRIRKAVRKGARFIGADSRTLRYNMPEQTRRRYQPGTALSLLRGLARVILDEELESTDSTERYIPDVQKLKELLAGYSVEAVSLQTGIGKASIQSVARAIATNGATYLFGEGILNAPDAAESARAIVILAALTGSLGREDAGVMPLFQECNAQGANDMGVRPDMLPGYQPVSDAGARERIQKLWGAPVPANAGLDLRQMLDKAASGNMQALFVMGSDPVKDAPKDLSGVDVAGALGKLRLLVVQDLYLTDTARLAHVVLPARSYLEKQGTFTNIERRVQAVRELLAPVGGARPDWQILAGIASHMGKDLGLSSSGSILREISQASPLHSRISYDTLGKFGRRWEIPL